MKKLIAGNWKMNGSEAGAVALIGGIGTGIEAEPELLERCDFLVCPPALHIHIVRQKIEFEQFPVAVGGQDCSAEECGAFTGDVSAAMLADCGCRYVILGHSERRANWQETSALASEKASRSHMHGLCTIICVGETEAQRESGKAFDVVGQQLSESLPGGTTPENTVIAYEPVWAIGTGKSATPDDVAAMHGFIRKRLQENVAQAANMRILYGGSVKPENAAPLFEMDNVNGALIGGASLRTDQFLGIARSA